MKRRCISFALALCFLLSGCTTEPSYIPPDFDYSTHTNEDEAKYRTVLADLDALKDGQPVLALREWPSYEVSRRIDKLIKDDLGAYDLCFCNASDIDLNTIKNPGDISFGTSTKWPMQLPDGYEPEEVLEFNKNPGLGIRALHAQGLTGSGVSIAIIDQALLTEHEEYKDNLMFYERVHCIDESPSMHGPAVASFAVGKDIGVAPDAKLYYIATTFWHYAADQSELDFSIIADCILRILEINTYLPENEKIRVISISRGYTRDDLGYQELAEAIKQADKAGVFVLTTSTDEFYNFKLLGMGRDYMSDPDNIHSYRPAGWFSNNFYNHPEAFYNDFYYVPEDSRTYAATDGNNYYRFDCRGGLSWAVPWFAGFYALCCQVKPDLTPKEFIAAVKEAAVTTEIEHDGTSYTFGHIVDPAATVQILQG